MAITGTNRQNKRKQVKKRPKLPINVEISIDVGRYEVQAEGRNSRCSEETMMMKR